MDLAQEVTQETWLAPGLCYAALTLGLTLLVKSLIARPGVPDNIPPFPARRYPFFGHLLHMRGRMREQLKEWVKTTGDVFSLNFGSRLVVVLSSHDVIHEAFIKQADSMSDRPPAIGDSVVKPNQGILTSSGHLWKEQRTVALQILRAFGMGKNMLALKVSEEVSAYLEALDQLSGGPSDVRTLTNTAVSNVICSIIVGNRFCYDDTHFIKFIHILNDQVRLNATTNLFSTFRWLRYLPGDLFNAKKRLENFRQIYASFCGHYVEKVEREYDENNLDNFISAYMYEMKKMEHQGKDTTLDKENLTRVLGNLFIAGSETTSTTILWFMVYMLHFPTVQAKVFSEIKEVVGTQRAPTMQDRAKLAYTNAAIMETQRLASIVPVAVPHYCNADTTIKGFTIPAGTMVLCNLDAVLWSEHTWESPMEFRPERFLDAHGNLTHPEQFVPFSIGRRLCLGESLAKMELFLFLTGLVQRFELLPAVPGQLPARIAVDGITSPPEAFQIRCVDRRDM